MSWRIVTEEWRLKLLAVGLAILMLGVVAFSENPPTNRTLSVPVSYQTGAGIVLIAPPARVNVTFNGLADAINTMTSDNVTATVDATKASPGQSVKLNVAVHPLIANVQAVQPAPIAVDIDKLQTVVLPVTVQAPAAPGWQVTKAVAVCPGGEPNPCTVTFTGPASWENNLTATVTNPGTVSYTGPQETPNLQIVLSNDRGLLDLSAQGVGTIPQAALNVIAVTVHVEAKPGSTYSTVPLVVAPFAHPPASGYQVTNVTVTPALVTLSGSQAALAKIRNITLQAADLSGRTSDATFTVEIQYPNGVTGDTATATVVYAINRIPGTSPTPP